MGDQFLKNFQSPSQHNFQMRLNRQINESINLNPLTPLQGPMQNMTNSQALLTDGFNPKSMNQPHYLVNRHNKLPLLSKNPFSSGMLPSHRLQANYEHHHNSSTNVLHDPSHDDPYHHMDTSGPLTHEDLMHNMANYNNYSHNDSQYLNMNLQANQYINANISMDHLNTKFKQNFNNEEALKLNEMCRASVPVHQSHPKFDSHPVANNTMIQNSISKPLGLGAEYLSNMKNIQSSMSSRLEAMEYAKGNTETPMNR